FADTHGLPEERFYNLLCLAYGADPVLFADADGYLPPTRLPNCEFEYRTLVSAFHKEISPHIDQEMARRVLDTNWLPDPKWKPVLREERSIGLAVCSSRHAVGLLWLDPMPNERVSSARRALDRSTYAPHRNLGIGLHHIPGASGFPRHAPGAAG